VVAVAAEVVAEAEAAVVAEAEEVAAEVVAVVVGHRSSGT
jgi:hypothetical protein